MSIKTKLDQEMKQIVLSQKTNNGLLLDTDDIHTIFKLLIKNDKEMTPILTVVYKFILESDIKDDYVLIEDSIKSILKYYNIIETNDLISCRHKFFFMEIEKKLTKKPFFAPKTVKLIRDELQINNIFKKLQ